MSNSNHSPIDCYGTVVILGSLVRILSLSGQWYDLLTADEKPLVESMIGEEFVVEEIDEYGHPWVRKSWSNEAEGTCNSHSIALEPKEMLYIGQKAI